MDEQLKIPGAITVAELIAQLQELDPQASVVIAYPSGDYWGTVLARAVRGDQVHGGLVEWSGYHAEAATAGGNSPNWEHVGDLGHVLGLVKRVVEFLSPEEVED